jgi:hypothetical protein
MLSEEPSPSIILKLLQILIILFFITLLSAIFSKARQFQAVWNLKKAPVLPLSNPKSPIDYMEKLGIGPFLKKDSKNSVQHF